MNPARQPVHGELISTDATGGVSVVIYKAGAVAAYTLAATETLVITDVVLNTQVEGQLWLQMDTNNNQDQDAGEMIAGGYFVVGGGVSHTFNTPYQCTVVAALPKLVAQNAGNVFCSFEGYYRTGA